MSIRSKLSKLVTADEGATMVEYALMLALIALILVGAVTTLGRTLSGFFVSTSEMLP